MAATLTQQQWFEKLKSFVPAWVFEENAAVAAAIFQGMAALFHQLDTDADDQFDATFLLKEAAPVLDMAGDERSKTRLTGETDPRFQLRVQRIISATDLKEIKATIDGLLTVPGCKVLESPTDSLYCNRGAFISRDEYLSDFFSNLFTVVVPHQQHAPYAFVARSNFISRSDFVGTVDAENDFYSSIIAAVEAQKAFGVLWRIIESTKSTVV